MTLQKESRMPTYIKKIPNSELALKEIDFQRTAAMYSMAPRIYDVDYINNGSVCVITMEKIDEMCIADKYGDDPNDVPIGIWKQIHAILELLYERERIEYIDITGYNFIEKNEKVYIIDFGHARKRGKKMNWFLQDFLKGNYGWNPDFA